MPWFMSLAMESNSLVASMATKEPLGVLHSIT
jgi:hypothetical protein